MLYKYFVFTGYFTAMPTQSVWSRVVNITVHGYAKATTGVPLVMPIPGDQARYINPVVL